MTSSPTLSPIQQGQFSYPECFGAFLRGDANGQKHKTQHVIEALVGALRQEGVVFGNNEAVDVLDVGCGPGLYAQKFLESVGKAFPGKIHYHGVDIDPDFVARAETTVSGLPNVESAHTTVANAFEGDKLTSRKVGLAQASHMVYHAADGSHSEAETTEKINHFTSSIMNSVADDGIAVLFHGGKESDMHGRIARNFGPLMWDAPDRIAAAAKAADKEVVELPVESKLYFPELKPASVYETLKIADNYKNFRPDSDELRWLKLLTFALHTDLKDLADKGTLGECIDFTRQVLDENRDRNGGYLMVRGTMQIVMNDPTLKPKIERAVEAVKEQIPKIDELTTRDMISEARKMGKTG